jgi:hypothetical protein
MDDLLSDVVAPRRTKMTEIREKLEPKDLKEFIEALETPTISQAALRRALAKRGIRIGVGTISELRRDHLRNKQ